VLVVFTGGGTGGHLYPALAIARALVRHRPDLETLFIGAQRGIERNVLPRTEFKHILLDLHPVYRSAPWRSWRTVRGLVGSWGRIREALGGRTPALVVATGGYASSATLAWCVMNKAPFVLQEQNSVPGQTNRLFSRWAREVYLGYPEAAMRLAGRAMSRAVHTGNPVEPPPDPRPSREQARGRFGVPPHARVLLVFGGSQGSAALNARIDAWIGAGLPDGLHIIWATGPSHFQRYAHRASDRVTVRDYLSPIADAYAATDLALTRAGAMTTAELSAWGIPMLLVPLPTAAADHQTANARALAEVGAARWIPEPEATAARLDAEVRSLLQSDDALRTLANGSAARARTGAANDIATRIAALLAPSSRP
jgi:UDP-N-acetylglucosamine--N-acetylmuramyl-(pentapeptide) pyrophosphoryl-undecaprenol N-acetylglucosamine transferase